MAKGKHSRRGKGPAQAMEDMKRRAESRQIDRKIEQSKNRQKLFAKLDPKTEQFARREFAKLGLY